MSLQANFDEAKQSQLAAVELLINMGYKYISPAEVFKERGNDNSKFILKDIAFTALKRINYFSHKGRDYRFTEKNVHDAISELENTPLEGLLDSSREVYNTLMSASGKTIQEYIDGNFESFDFRFIDFDEPSKNEFHVTIEYTAEGRQTIRPDIVLFVNGIPFCVIENKKSGTKIDEALSQIVRNQTPEYCPKLFIFTQLLIATNKSKLLYGTTATPSKFYAHWKEKGPNEVATKRALLDLEAKVQNLIKQELNKDLYSQICSDINGSTNSHAQITDRLVSEQDRGIVSLLEPTRMLDLAKNFILFDGGIKKVSRYQQYFAIKQSLQTLETEMEGLNGATKRKGGIIWHTQGSGKSLTMVLFVKALIEDPRIKNPRVIIVTDRKDLNTQISDTFRACNLKKDLIEAKTGAHLLKLIKEQNLNVITTLVHKFQSAKKLKADFVDESSEIFVLIDEAHRTQSGMANAEMNRIIPNACYIGFTGTPLMKKEKASWRKFGDYIDKYTIDDALQDGVILPLIYEGRYVQLIQNEAQIDRHVDRITKDYTDAQKKEFQKKASKKTIVNNPKRIAEIAYDIQNHYIQNFQGTGLKAQIVAPSKYSAILFQKYFQDFGAKINTAVVISEAITAEDEKDTHKKDVADFIRDLKSNYKDLASYESQVINSFKNNDEGIGILIVVDKLLTGFDAPRNTVLYLAKELKDHNLLQAIARVNRLHDSSSNKSPKTAGFIIDYSENAKNIDSAMKLFGSYDDQDVKNALIDVIAKKNELESSYSDLHEIFKEVQNSKDDELYINKLEDEATRQNFYNSLNNFIRLFSECLSLQEFATTFKDLDTYKKDLKKFLELRKTVRDRFADNDQYSEYKMQLVRILDEYIDAKEVEVLTKPLNINDREAFAEAMDNLGSDKSRAEAIGAHTQRVITEKMDNDPEFYHKFSEKIKEILQKMHEGKIADIEALNLLRDTNQDIINKRDDSLPDKIISKPGADIFYRNLVPVLRKLITDENQITETILALFTILTTETIVDWHKNLETKRVISNKIDDYLYDTLKIKLGLNISNDDIQKLLDMTMTLAINNFDIF